MTAPNARPLHLRPRVLAVTFLSGLALGAFVGCDSLLPSGPDGDEGPPAITALPRALLAQEEAVLASSNEFGFDLLREIVQSEPDSSHFISPLSASLALGMTMNGARGETLDQMRGTLRFEGMEPGQINASYRGLINLLSDLDPEVSFRIASSMWHTEEEAPAPLFVETLDSYFDAPVRGLDFGDPAAPATMNAWVRERTGGRIEEIVPDPIPADVVAYLLNAIHFEGDWTYRFDPEETYEGPFHLAEGGTATVPFMTRAGGFRHAASPGWDAVDLPYGGQAYSMTVVIPRAETTVGSLVASLDAGSWDQIVAALDEPHPGTAIALPRFTMEWERSLKKTLAALGMPLAFSPAADFTAMFPAGGVFITEVLQKTWVRVDEEGTEAAAATSVEMGRVSLPPVIRADRPFLFAIRERLSGTILFLGVVVEAPSG